MISYRAMTAAAVWLPLMIFIGCRPAGHSQDAPDHSYSGWHAYGGNAGGTRYAALRQIHRGNVDSLQVAWTYRTGELGQGSAVAEKLTFEATPIFFEGTLYLSTAFGNVIALDPATGAERWTFDAETDRSKDYSELTSRGVSVWRDAEADAGDACRARIFVATIDARLIALDAATGAPCEDFGEGGQVDLATGFARDADDTDVDYQVTSPPAVVGDVVVVGSSIGDNWNVDTGSGAVRAFDARTGAQVWRWNPIRRDTMQAGAANAWSILSADPERDLVFVPTSSPSPDFYGGLRPGANRHANSVVALRASTGEVVWSFQTVHHDLWDYDVAAQPALVTVRRDGETIPAVAQATKMGLLFVLHRETGEPLFPVEKRPVPQTTVPGEETSPTQPFPTLPRPLMPHDPLTPEDAWGPTPEDRAACQAALAGHRNEGIYTPPSLEGTIMYPGNASGTNWGSVAYDPERGLLVLTTSELATLVQLIPRNSLADVRTRTARSGVDWEFGAQRGAPYAMRRRTLLSPSGMPCNPPPWGTLAAVDLSTGEVRWEVSVGERDGQTIGLPIFGGPMVTAGGLIFMGGTMDDTFRAFDVESGEVLWSTELPRSAIATPMTYRTAEGKQYVVIAAGGHGKLGLPTGDYVVAFTLL